MRIWPRSHARRQREALTEAGRSMAAGFAAGIRAVEAHVAARPEGVTVEEWQRQGLAETMAAIEANPLHHRMVAAAHAMLGVEDENQQQ